MLGLPDDFCSLIDLSVAIGDCRAQVRYIGPLLEDGARQINIQIPEAAPLGNQHLVLLWRRRMISSPLMVDVHASPVLQPRLLSITDGKDLTVENVIRCGRVQISLEGCTSVETLRAIASGCLLRNLGGFCEDPLHRRYQVNLESPLELVGRHTVRLWVDGREFEAREVDFLSDLR